MVEEKKGDDNGVGVGSSGAGVPWIVMLKLHEEKEETVKGNKKLILALQEEEKCLRSSREQLRRRRRSSSSSSASLSSFGSISGRHEKTFLVGERSSGVC